MKEFVTKKLLLSVVLATYNEEQNIQKCLNSVQSIADEIIVVDGSSSDSTAAVASALGAQVISTTNKQNFHINKQLAIDAASGQVILQLDADEVVDEELSTFLHDIKLQVETNTLPPQPVAWYIRRKNYLFNHWLSKGGQYPDPVIRLFIRGKAKLPQKDVHEQLRVDGDIGTTPGHLLHYSYPTFSEYLRKFDTYTSFAATQLDATMTKTTVKPSVIAYIAIKPVVTFFSLYLRHRGYVDGMAGFVFALMSALHHPFVYLKYWELQQLHRRTVDSSVK